MFLYKACLPFNNHEAFSALHRCSSDPLVMMDGPVKTFQDAGNRIIANQILDRKKKKKTAT